MARKERFYRFNNISSFLLLLSVIIVHYVSVHGKIFLLSGGNEEENEEAEQVEEGADEEDEIFKLRQKIAERHILPLDFPGIQAEKQMTVESTDITRNDPLPPWDEFEGDMDEFLEQDLDPGSWKVAMDASIAEVSNQSKLGNTTALYLLGVKQFLGARGVSRNLLLALESLGKAAEHGHPHAQSALAFLHASGYGVPLSDVKSFLYHGFASGGNSFQSKMALAYSFLRQQEYRHSVGLYAEVAAKTVATNHILGTAPLVEAVRLSAGGEENLEATRGHRGEEDETIQYIVYTAWNGNVHSLRTLGNLYYLGARGLPRDYTLAFDYFRKAAEQGDSLSMVNVGEMYFRGVGVQRDYALAHKWLHDAANQGNQLAALSAAKGLGYLYARGFGVEQNYTKAMAYFMTSAKRHDADGLYYLGVMNFRGFGTKTNYMAALRYFSLASDKNHLAAVYQLAKMNHHGIGIRQNIHTATILYKAVAERGPWGSLLRWAHTFYMDGDIGTSLLLYSRAAELGFEVAQSNAAWLLDKFQGESGCVGSGGARCLEWERHVRAHRFWRHSSEQGNVQAALLIGDAYYYGKGTKKDLERAVEAYRRAKDKHNAQAMFNLGYMHEHGLGLPMDLHLAKRFYDEALEADPDAELPVRLALMGLWLRLHHPDSSLMKAIDQLPELLPSTVKRVKTFMRDEGNLAVMTLLALLGAVLYVRSQRQRRIPIPVVQNSP